MKIIKNILGSTKKQPEVTSLLQELQSDILLWVPPGLFITGFMLILNAANFRDPIYGALTGVLIYGLAIAILIFRKNHYLISAWTLVICITFLILLFNSLSGIGEAVYLLGLPVGMTILLINPAGGVFVALAYMLLFFTPVGFINISASMKVTATINIWSTVGLLWLSVNPLKTTLERAWMSYKESRQLLEQARNYQADLGQALEDLGYTNLQLTRLNRLVNNLYQVAEDARRAKEQFVANVSHELRTPLNMILGFGEMILKSPSTYGRKIPPALLADLTVIFRNSQHLSELIDDVLDLSQIDAGQMAITKEQASLNEIVESATIVVWPLYETKKLFLKTEFPEEAMIFCDLTRIREVLINLLSNAGRFTEKGGVWLRIINDGSNYVFSVTDTGPGISAEEQSRLFQPFNQLDNSIKRRYGGTGLGLTISKKFIELHNGKIWVESVKGCGSTFYFSLPVAPLLPLDQRATRWINPYFEPRHRPSLAPVPVIQTRYIVVEEGNTLHRLLQRYGDQVEVEHAASYDEALQKLSTMPAQGIIINSENAQDIFQDLKNEDLIPYGTPVIACNLPQLSERNSGLNISGYLVKPISKETLLETLTSFQPPVKTVMIVDDEPDAIQLFRRMLISSNQDYRILTALDGKQALAMMQVDKPDLILLDLIMPEMDGIQLLASRSSDPNISKIPVIIISARDPIDQPLCSHSLLVTRGGGLPVSQILTCITVLSDILGTTGSPTRQAFSKVPSG